MGETANAMAPGRAAPHAHRNARALPLLASVPQPCWDALAADAIEPNGYFLSDWALAVDASARSRTDLNVLRAHRDGRLVGLLPVVSLRRAYGLPLPALTSADPYGTLGTPLLARDDAPAAMAGLMAAARASGAHALVLRDIALDGPAMAAVASAAEAAGVTPHVLHAHRRACLDATQDSDILLRDALGAKKLKELRRQRNRLAEHGEVTFDVARGGPALTAALDDFLVLEASGWKARRGTALGQHDGDRAFVTRAVRALAAIGACEIVTLRAGTAPVAAGIVVRHLDRAFYFKLGVNERFARLSPGVQLTLELTKHLCADPAIASADSTAIPGHPMIDPIWRGRLAIGDVLLPLRPRDPTATLIRGILMLRQSIREPLRRAVRSIRKRQEKPS